MHLDKEMGMGMEMQVVGPDVYLFTPKEVAKIRCQPRDIIDCSLSGALTTTDALEGYLREKVASHVIGVSTAHNGWCGVQRHRLLIMLDTPHSSHDWERIIDLMVEAGLLRIVRVVGFFRLRDSRNIICPTPWLIQRILENNP